MNKRAWGGIAGLLSFVVAGCGGLPKIGTGGGTPCSVSTDCSGGKVCAAGTCNQPGAAGMGSPCSATRDCGGGLACDALAAKCLPGGTIETGGACTADAQCKPPLRCDLAGFFGTCAASGTTDIGGVCQAGIDCLSGLLCANDRCAAPTTAFPPWPGATCTDDGDFRAYFEIPRPGQPPRDFFRLPFPNDLRVSAAGALDISDFPRPGPTPLGVDLVQLYVDQWTADFDGFGANGAITFRFSKDIEYGTTTGDNVQLIDLTSGFGLSRSWVTYNGRTKYTCAHTVIVHSVTDEPLEPNHKYAAILTTGIKSEAGESPVVDPDMIALLGATRPSDETLGLAWDEYGPLRAWLTKQGAMAPTVAAAAVFTVQNAPGHMQRLAANLAAQPAPVLKQLTLCSADAISPCADGTPERACGTPDPTFDEIHGKFTVPIYQTGTAPYETPADGGHIVETAGVPAPTRTEDVCFALTVPKGAPPVGGWPLVVYHHGTGGSMRSFIGDGVAKAMADGTGTAAVFGFDGIHHGARRGASSKKPDDLVFNPLNPRAARDNFLQGAVDILQALRLVSVTVDAATSPTGSAIVFNPTRVAYYGHSQGSTSGELAVAFSATAGAAVFSGAGAYLTRSLLDKSKPVNIGAGMAYLIGEPLDAEHPVLTIFQSYFERSDPLNYNPLIVARPPAAMPSKHVYMSWGKGDTYTPQKTLEANARSLGIPPVAPLVDDYMVAPKARPVTLNVTAGDGALRTVGVFQYTPPSGVDGHFVTTKVEPAITDWTAFLTSYLTGGTPLIP